MTQITIIATPGGDSQHDEKYDLKEGTVTMSGTQVLARLPLEQRSRDQHAGLNTGGFISGYRGSPLGGYDQELWRMGTRLLAANVHFQPGINEDLAATALWGSQYIGLYPGAKVDGVFGIWYGKSPGVDRSGDAFQHANTAGTSPNGGVIALVGDDHGAKSSSRAGQSDMQLKACGMPILYPSNVQEILDFGLHGIAMSRYSACWVAIKLVTDVLEVSSKVNVGNSRALINLPPLPTHTEGGLHIRANEPPLDMEARLYEHKLPAAIAYARANGLNKILLNPAQPKLGIISAGKSWGDVRGALASLNLDDEAAEKAGLRLLKIGMTWPLDPQILREFVSGLECVLVVEEKRPFLEEHIKAALYDEGAAGHLRVVGKLQPAGMGGFEQGLLPMAGELTPQIIAKAIAHLANLHSTAVTTVSLPGPGPVRLPNFCSGCPHNTSTVVPDGSRAMAGIGCHGMAMWIRPENTSTVTHMGAEGMFWVGQAPFTNEKHVFVNIGDGTFFHSGSLALRQAVAAKMRVTYKVLFNGYVSMTGGQPHDGDLTVARVIDIVMAEGVGRVVVVTDDTEKYHNTKLPHNVPVRPRTELDAVQRELRDFIGVSVLVYDQVCATELRRQRKSNPALDIAKRTIINAEVCEGCGDCSVKSNCMSLEPLETELGRKRRINQSSCNKDFSCVQGFCPSFVTVHGGQLKRPVREVSVARTFGELPIPELPPIGIGYNVLIAGIGGTGIVTVSSILAQAAQLDQISASVLDLTGMAQKYGAVMSHLRFMPLNTLPPNSRLGSGEADLVIGCDLVVTTGQEAVSKMSSGRTFVVVNTAINPTLEFQKSPDWDPNVPYLLDRLNKHLKGEVNSLQASQIATALMGDAIAINLFLLGYAWQLGKVPIRLEALQKAINLQGVELKFNLESFQWGRRMATEPDVIKQIAAKATGQQVTGSTLGPLHSIEEIVNDRERRLVNYQNAAYAKRYRNMIDEIQVKDDALNANGQLARAAARGYYKLLANKDEYEVARLYSTPEFRQTLEAQFEGSYKLHFHLGVWPFAVQQKGSDVLTKREVGPWILTVMKLLQHFRWVRGRWMDPFRNTKERMLAKELIARYEDDLKLILSDVKESSLEAAVSLASLPEKIRGYGHVRSRHAKLAEQERAILRGTLES
jgi:indolepyruvate ferredoxin oxidoreductase